MVKMLRNAFNTYISIKIKESQIFTVPYTFWFQVSKICILSHKNKIKILIEKLQHDIRFF